LINSRFSLELGNKKGMFLSSCVELIQDTYLSSQEKVDNSRKTYSSSQEKVDNSRKTYSSSQETVDNLSIVNQHVVLNTQFHFR
jgi:hypothetical protein